MARVPPCVPVMCGKDFRKTLKRPSPNYNGKPAKYRLVPAFTIQAMQINTKVIPPPKCNVFDPLPPKPTMFMSCYRRGEFPISIQFCSGGKKLHWKVPIEKLDFHYYLPIFFDGLAVVKYPFNFIVEQGIKDMITTGAHKILPVVPQLIIPIKKALCRVFADAFDTKRPAVLIHAMKALQMIVTGCDKVGEALVPYYRHILPALNLFKLRSTSLGSSKEIRESRGENVADTLEDTLQILERYGGPDAFVNLKYMIPTYESFMQ